MKCKDTVNDLGNFTVYAGDEFAGGNGSPSNPYKVSTIEQFKKIVGHANACFIQTTDLDFEYENLEPMFSAAAFAGTYDGNNKKISNVGLTNSIFMNTASNAILKNMVIDNAIENIPTGQPWNAGILVCHNYGKIDSCTVNASMNGGDKNHNWYNNFGLIVYENYGTINNSKSSGTLRAIGYKGYVGPIAAVNHNGAKITNCTNTAEIRIDTYHLYAGGIVGQNEGTIISSSTTKAPTDYNGNIVSNPNFADIAGLNTGTIQNSYYNAN